MSTSYRIRKLIMRLQLTKNLFVQSIKQSRLQCVRLHRQKKVRLDREKHLVPDATSTGPSRL